MVKVDKNKCIGCGSCAAICPKAFKMKNGKAEFVGKGKEDCLTEAKESCPVDAIN